ncbi:HAD domain-containing protein [Nocardioides halotolerans]|uniref:HAD domain-containing protein n=1 Tax=Nocardioides halotolerans TaxID=433660 RepID=UPI00040033D3|nr:HAD domain-containing protein [Nocardioides halotolerans]
MPTTHRSPRPARALIVDVDGVVSPVHGHTAWGDDVVAGEVFGPVLVSPTLCRRLDQLAARPDLTTWWLTSWPAQLRDRMDPFPGRTWPQITSQLDDPGNPHPDWWKWTALMRWLDQQRAVNRLAWCDDHLTDTHLAETTELDELDDASGLTSSQGDHTAYGISTIRMTLAGHGIEPLLLAPRTSVGITPAQMTRLERFLTRASPGR